MSHRDRRHLIQTVGQDPELLEVCFREIEAIRAAVTPSRIFIEHVGSTAVRGLPGKPVIDLLVSLVDWVDAEKVVVLLADSGYQPDSETSDSARRFLEREIKAGSVKAIHLHLTPLQSDWGNDMLVFRDELIADKELAVRYDALKRTLAVRHSDDFEAYTSGKTGFVESVLRSAAGTFGNDRLLTHQRAEFARAQVYQYLVLASQFLVALTAALSVYYNDNRVLLVFALVGFVLAGIWFALASWQRIHRDAGEQARRVVLIASGLGETLSSEQRLRIFDKFTVSIEGRHLVREESYFASRAVPGYQRLAELIEESAYWTRDLQRSSASALLWGLLSVTLLIAVVLVASSPELSPDASLSMARVSIAFLVFLLSSDVVGALLAHREAARAIDEILHRVETAAARGYPSADVLLIASDYNAAVESAPFSLPGIYEIRSKTLARRWRAYLVTKRLTSKAQQ